MSQQETGFLVMFAEALSAAAARRRMAARSIPTNGNDRRLLADLIAQQGGYWVLIEFKDSAAGAAAERDKPLVPSVCRWLRADPVAAGMHERAHHFSENHARDLGFWVYRTKVCSLQPSPPTMLSEQFFSSLLTTSPTVGLNTADFLDYVERLLAQTASGKGGAQDVVLAVAVIPDTCYHDELSLPDLVQMLSPSPDVEPDPPGWKP
ncbi:hypothetical protein [Xanthomonas theicola]|uniref:Uncharacterized protein n=1 Tax=Xanthomonas theicola TaxID=56464 RepID=A0A2S6ZF81_9XANT|nr:hypothetical protein [Xanthomonas theicola]PPT90799.1 hypothetical protein XthCFBP4691_10545 [Xanthomonas theicola]QNH23806.1 hypothetical protein G4Q83_02150 [Xanthomonas theicola]